MLNKLKLKLFCNMYRKYERNMKVKGTTFLRIIIFMRGLHVTSKFTWYLSAQALIFSVSNDSTHCHLFLFCLSILALAHYFLPLQSTIGTLQIDKTFPYYSEIYTNSCETRLGTIKTYEKPIQMHI